MNKTVWDYSLSLIELKSCFGERIKSDWPLANYTTFGTGGTARLFIEISSGDELKTVLNTAIKFKIPYFLLGGGSNVLISDSGYNGLVIKNCIMGLECHGNTIICGAGENLQKLVDFATQNSLSGLEFATGIWGTMGGAVYGNAGAYGAEIKDVLCAADLIDRQGVTKTVKAEELHFDYRYSILKKTGDIVIRATFALKPGKKESIYRKVEEIMVERNRKLPLDRFSAGCFFKNIPDKRQKFGKLSAGRLLEEVGAKKMKFGGARVFEKHANIIVNDGSANSDQIYKLAGLLKSKVKDKFGISLAEEVILLGDFKEELV